VISQAARAKSSDERHGIFSPTSVIVITERTGKLIQNNFVEHRGVPYAILLGTAQQQWRVAIYPVPNQLPKERTVFGTREDAVTTARSMINSWLKRQQRTALKNAKQ
jgi:hypothetical protein